MQTHTGFLPNDVREGDKRPQNRNYEEAIKWYTLAAKQGDAMAQCNLGHIYSNEQTGKKDFVKAHMWFNIGGAKEKESTEKLMNPSEITEAQQLAREWTLKNLKK